MKGRQWSRIHLSSYKPTNSSLSFRMLLFYLALFMAYLSLQIWHFKRIEGYILEYILVGTVSLFFAIASSFVRWFPRLIIFESYLFLWFFCTFSLYNSPNYYIPLGTIVLGLISLTILYWIVNPYIIRAFSRCRGSRPPKIIHDDVSMRYEIHQNVCCSPAYICVYEGPMKRGKPHGLGIWVDSSYHGEFLKGYFSNGIPIGPFESIESETRNILVNLRIIFATNCGGRFWLTRTPLHYGVASVEACISGFFYKNYPLTQMISPPTCCTCEVQCKCIKDIIRNKLYKHIDDERKLNSISVNIDGKTSSLHIPGFYSLKNRNKEVSIKLNKKSKTEYDLVLDNNWVKGDTTEGLLFIHGMYHSLEDSLKRFGQFLALGNFPPRLKTFVYNWPSSSNPLLYYQAQNLAIDESNHDDLLKFLKAIRAGGIENISIMCHSMGARVLLSGFRRLKELFVERVDNIESDMEDSFIKFSMNKESKKHKLEILNLILLNPDYELENFAQEYEELSKYCKNITIYADGRDVALKFSTRLNKKMSLGNNIKPILDTLGNTLDVDIIDTGDLDRNMNSQFHGYFNINRAMVDDLRELIADGMYLILNIILK